MDNYHETTPPTLLKSAVMGGNKAEKKPRARLNVDRYDPVLFHSQGGKSLGDMELDKEGEWIKFEDYQALLKELKR